MTSADALADTSLVPGIYEHCDEWCSYCHMTGRCLAHRRVLELAEERGGVPFGSMDDVVEFSREVCAAEGRPTFELDALASPDPAVRALVPELDDPLDDMAAEYAFHALRFLERRHWMPPVQPGPQPSALDVVAWYHGFVSMKLGRALMSAARGSAERMMDANGCAKAVLVGIDRSRAALRRLRGEDDERRVASLLDRLERLRSAIEDRFPSARTYIRPGLDGPIA